MSGTPTAELDWSNLSALSNRDIALLADAAIEVLRSDDTDNVVPAGNLAKRPRAVLRDEVAEALQSAGVDSSRSLAAAASAVQDPQISRDLAVGLLEILATDPQLRKEITDAFQARGGMMAIDGGLLIGAALLILAMKVKRIRLTKKELDVDFYKYREEMLDGVKAILGL